MRNSLAILFILPVFAWSIESADDFFFFNDRSDEALLHITTGEDQESEVSLFDSIGALEEQEEFDGQALSLFEDKLDSGEGLPWKEEMTADQMTQYIEKKAKQMTPDFDDVFVYDVPTQRQPDAYRPSAEKISKNRRQGLSRPRVVQSKPQDDKASSPSKHRKAMKKRSSKKGQIVTKSSVSTAQD